MKSVKSFFVFWLLFSFIVLLPSFTFGQASVTDPIVDPMYTPWGQSFSGVSYIMPDPDGFKMDNSRFIFTEEDTSQIFYQAGRPNKIIKNSIKWIWFYDFGKEISMVDSATIEAKFQYQTVADPQRVQTCIGIDFYNPLDLTAIFCEGKDLSLSVDQKKKYTWVNSNSDKKSVPFFSAIGMPFQMGGDTGLVELSVEVFDLKLWDDGKVIFHDPFNPILTDVPRETTTTMDFTLEQNYPNPFNPSTSIAYHIARNSNVTLKVYDVLGREVATLVNGEKSPGTYEVKFDGSNLTSGMYLYRLQAGNTVISKKMLLMK